MASKTMDFETHTMTPVNAARLIKAMILAQKPVFVHGSPGIGKSDIIRQIGRDLVRNVYDVRLLLMGEQDIRGIPFYNASNGKMEWAPPSTFPLEEDSTGIIFLDEITQASPSVQAAALQLVLDRKIGDFTLPEKVSIVAAGNRASDKTGAKALIKALANRFLHINLEMSFKEWQIWAIENEVHPDVVAFLSQNPSLLNQFDPASPENSFGTPRTWVFFVSDLLKSTLIPDDLLFDAIAGSVGQSSATLFKSMREILTKLPSPEDVIMGKVKKLGDIKQESRIAIQFQITTACSYKLREMHMEAKQNKLTMEEWYDRADTFIKFANDNLEPEICMMGLNSAIKVHKLPFHPNKMPNMKSYMEKNMKYFKGMMSV